MSRLCSVRSSPLFKEDTVKRILTSLALVLAAAACAPEDGTSPPDDEGPNLIEAPTGLEASALSRDTIEIRWRDTSDYEDGFEVLWSRDADGPFQVLDEAPADSETYVYSEFESDMTFYFRVAAFVADQYVESQEMSSAKTLAIDSIPPSAPESLRTTTILHDQVSLSWLDTADNSAGFIVSRAVSTDGPFEDVASREIRSYVDEEVDPDTVYFYRVRAFNVSGESEYTEGLMARTLPMLPTNLTAEALASNFVRLEWQDNTDNEIRFRVERACPTMPLVNQLALQCTKSFEIDAGSTNVIDVVFSGVDYVYRMRAETPTGDSRFTAYVSVETP